MGSQSSKAPAHKLLFGCVSPALQPVHLLLARCTRKERRLSRSPLHPALSRGPSEPCTPCTLLQERAKTTSSFFICPLPSLYLCFRIFPLPIQLMSTKLSHGKTQVYKVADDVCFHSSKAAERLAETVKQQTGERPNSKVRKVC